jgi:hypothetical protein
MLFFRLARRVLNMAAMKKNLPPTDVYPHWRPRQGFIKSLSTAVIFLILLIYLLILLARRAKMTLFGIKRKR